jgi:hypothetical protein
VLQITTELLERFVVASIDLSPPFADGCQFTLARSVSAVFLVLHVVVNKGPTGAYFVGGVVQRNALGQASAQPKTEEAEHKTHNYALVQFSKLGTSVAVKFATAEDGQVHYEGRHKTSQKAQASYA